MVSQHEPEHQVDPLMRLVQRPSTIMREQLALHLKKQHQISRRKIPQDFGLKMLSVLT